MGNLPATGEFPAKGPVTRKLFPFDDVNLLSTSVLIRVDGWQFRQFYALFNGYKHVMEIWIKDKSRVIPYCEFRLMLNRIEYDRWDHFYEYFSTIHDKSGIKSNAF